VLGYDGISYYIAPNTPNIFILIIILLLIGVLGVLGIPPWIILGAIITYAKSMIKRSGPGGKKQSAYPGYDPLYGDDVR
jgi:hypothetical protein